MKKFILTLIVAAPLICSGKSLDSIHEPDGGTYLVRPFNTITYVAASDMKTGKIKPFNCWVMYNKISDVNAPYYEGSANYWADPGATSNFRAKVGQKPTSLMFQGALRNKSIENAFFHFENLSQDQSFLVTCRYVG